MTQPVHYVTLASAAPAPPYGSWTTAATNIQDAVDAADRGALVLVGKGVYAMGARPVGRPGYPYLTIRVAVDKPLGILSMNGPESTVILGRYDTVCGVPDQPRQTVRLYPDQRMERRLV